eukprot:6406394-Pyramimonas_sp.AAC.1
MCIRDRCLGMCAASPRLRSPTRRKGAMWRKSSPRNPMASTWARTAKNNPGIEGKLAEMRDASDQKDTLPEDDVIDLSIVTSLVGAGASGHASLVERPPGGCHVFAKQYCEDVAR